MFVQKSIVQDFSHPEIRQLILKDTDHPDETKSVLLPKNGEIVQDADGMFDYYGRRVEVEPSIKEIKKVLNEKPPIFLVERRNGDLAIAAIEYVMADKQRISLIENWPLENGKVKKVELACCPGVPQFSRVHFFDKRTPFGEAFSELGLKQKFGLGYLADGSGAIMISAPYRCSPPHDYFPNVRMNLDCIDAVHLARGKYRFPTLLFPRFSIDGKSLMGKFRLSPNSTLGVTISTSDILALKGRYYDKNDFSIPVRSYYQ